MLGEEEVRMARLARLVIPGLPYHVTQRGNRRGTTFFEEDDFLVYRELLADAARTAETKVWAYCLMPNHVHLIVVPSDPDGLRAAFANAHRRYARFINARNRWTGHLWQGRFGAVVMDEAHLVHAARYVALNPVRARLCERAEDWPWSSARAHLAGEDDGLVEVAPLLERVGDFAAFLGTQETSRRRAPCEWRRPAGGRSAMRHGWRRWRSEPGASWRRRNADGKDEKIGYCHRNRGSNYDGRDILTVEFTSAATKKYIESFASCSAK